MIVNIILFVVLCFILLPITILSVVCESNDRKIEEMEKLRHREIYLRGYNDMNKELMNTTGFVAPVAHPDPPEDDFYYYRLGQHDAYWDDEKDDV